MKPWSPPNFLSEFYTIMHSKRGHYKLFLATTIHQFTSSLYFSGRISLWKNFISDLIILASALVDALCLYDGRTLGYTMNNLKNKNIQLVYCCLKQCIRIMVLNIYLSLEYFNPSRPCRCQLKFISKGTHQTNFAQLHDFFHVNSQEGIQHLHTFAFFRILNGKDKDGRWRLW